MYFRIFKITLLLAVLFSVPTLAQKKDDAEKQREEFEKKIQEKLTTGINTFVLQLDADDFQKEIIKQKLHVYYQKQKTIYMNSGLKTFERDEQLSVLNNTHFLDIENMISDDTMSQIQIFIKDVGTTLEKQKKKKKKNKSKKDE